MQNVKVGTHKRKGRVVRTHVRKQKTGVAAPAPKAGAGGEIKAKAASRKPRFAKGSSEAKAHMAKIRAMRKPKNP